MTENTTELVRPLVVGHKRDGRSCYDPEAKRQLIEACLRPRVSVARLIGYPLTKGMRHGRFVFLRPTFLSRASGLAKCQKQPHNSTS